MIMIFLGAVFFFALLLSLIFSFFIAKLAVRWNVIDVPAGERKIHKKPTPLLGGAAIFLSFFLVLFLARDRALAGNLEWSHWLGVFAGGLFLMIGGFLDDKYNLRPGRQLVFPALAVVSVLLGGVQIEKLTNPFGGFLEIGGLKIFSSILIALWLIGMMYTTKLLDGLDGLVAGIAGIGAFVIFLFTMTTRYHQPDIGLAALILAGAAAGFLVLNWHPAKIFLGEGGSLFLGFILGVLAIISGGKIAIALLVMGVPILDTAWTIIRRLAAGQNPFKFADRRHLHHRLFDAGLGVRKTVLLFHAFSLVFGLAALFLQSQGKILALALLVVLMFLLVIWLNAKEK